MNSKDKIKLVLALFVLSSFIGMVMWLFEFYTHTMGNTKLSVIALIISILSACIYLYLLKKREKEPMYFGAYIFIFILFLSYLHPIPFIINRYMGYGDIAEKSFPILKIDAVHEAPYGILDEEDLTIDYYKIWFDVGGKEHKLNLDEAFKNRIIEEEIILPIRKGFWGFDQIILK